MKVGEMDEPSQEEKSLLWLNLMTTHLSSKQIQGDVR
jgi:hypothetical protein